MVKLYVKRIRAGLLQLEDVPPRWRAATAAALNEEGDLT